MKNKLILVVLLIYVGALLPMYHAPSWRTGLSELYNTGIQKWAALKNWVAEKTPESVKEKAFSLSRAATIVAPEAASSAYNNRYKVAAGTVIGSTVLLNEMFKSGTLSQDTAQNLLWGVAGIALVATGVSQIYAWYQKDQITEKQAEATIEDCVRNAINNDILFPTHKSKIDALTHKNEFLGALQDTDGLFDKACEKIRKELEPQVSLQTDKDKKIDKTITAIENSVKDRSTLQEKITALENAQGFAFVQAYMSYYLRLKNRLAVQEQQSKQGGA